MPNFCNYWCTKRLLRFTGVITEDSFGCMKLQSIRNSYSMKFENLYRGTVLKRYAQFNSKSIAT